MRMMYCRICGWTFDADEIDSFETYCPSCGEEDDIDDAYECADCGQYFPKDMLFNDYCPDCKDAVLKRFQTAMSNFSVEERELITDAYEGCYL